MKVRFSSIDTKLSPVDRMAGVCFKSTKLRFVNALLGDRLRQEGIGEDLIQEVYASAWQAWREGMTEIEALRLTGRRVDAFLKAYGFKHDGGRREVFLPQDYWGELKATEVEDDGDGANPQTEKPPRRKLLNKEMSVEEKILLIARVSPNGISKRELYSRLKVSAREFDRHLAPLIKQHQVTQLLRENSFGRPLTPLLFIATAKIPEEMMGAVDKKERIRQAYFAEGKGIKQIAREFHHCKRTVRKAICLNNALEPGEPRSANHQQSRLKAPATASR